MKLDLVTNASIDDDTRRLTLTKTVVKREAKVINLSMAETIWEDMQAELNNRSRIVDV
jgi:hypothetical protein